MMQRRLNIEKTEESKLSELIGEFENLFSIFNNHFYDGKLITPVITIIPRGKRRCAGWCSGDMRWVNPNKLDGDSAKGYYEINICAEYIASDFEVLVEVMLHEMVHLYNAVNGIQDTSRNGTYHNQMYKNAAELHGLCVEKDDRYGYAITSLNSITKEYIKTLTPFKFDLSRIEKGTQGRKKQSMIKVACPVCGCIARVTSEKTKIKCASCDVVMF